MNQSTLRVGAACILSLIITVGFVYVTMRVLILGDAASTPLSNVMLGTLSALASTVANYWLGSSSGSALKDSAIVTPNPTPGQSAAVTPPTASPGATTPTAVVP